MKIRLLPGLLLLLFLPALRAADKAAPIPGRGVLDLRECRLDRDFLMNLNGEWEFFWEEFLVPGDFPQRRGSGMVVSVPSYWSDYELNGEELPGFGYGTYALTILIPEKQENSICFDIPLFDVAHRFYLNDRLIHENGTVGTTREEEKPWYEPTSMCMVPDADTLQILVQVSNFHHRRGGFWQPVQIGGSKALLNKREHRKMYNYSTIGVLFFFTIFFFLFWVISRSDINMVLFALTSSGILMRSVNTGMYFSNYFIDTPWTWQIRMEYVGTYLAMASGGIFLHRILPRKYMRPVVIGNALLMLLLILLVFTLPPWLFSYTMLVFQPLVILLLVHYLLVSVPGVIRGQLTPIVFFLSLGIFLYTLINDILLANTGGGSTGSYLSQISFQVFILAMALLVIVNWVNNDKLRLKLEASLRFKNRVLSVIAHDLKNPVASVAQFSDLLATKPELSTKREIMQSLQESSQAAVVLLDNLLYWGRAQSDDMKVNTAPNSLAYADKSLVNIVISNLISNAVKFTPPGGQVMVETLREEDAIRITVSDTGIGIKPEILDQFLKEGKLVSTQGTDREVGTGLGLQLVSDLVERNGGSLDVKSTLRKGSTFSFTLPRANEQENDTEENQ